MQFVYKATNKDGKTISGTAEAASRQALLSMLRKQGVKAMNVLGSDFDPNVHMAVMHEDSPGHREGEVIGELQKGYMLNDRLLRPAMVKVAK